MRHSRSVTLGLLATASLGVFGRPTAPFKGLESIVVTGGSLNEPVVIDTAADLRAICTSIRATTGAWLGDSTLPPAATAGNGGIYLTFYGAAFRADVPAAVNVGIVRPPAKPGALGMITMLPGADGVPGPEQLCSTWVEDRVLNPNAAPAGPGTFVMTEAGAAVLRRYGVFPK